MKKVFILTGEPSGDILASKVISKLKIKNPGNKLFMFRWRKFEGTE